jgi:hypothetical protein
MQSVVNILGAGTGRHCDSDDDRLVALGKRNRKFAREKEKLQG